MSNINSDKNYGVGGRLNKGADDLLVQTAYSHDAQQAKFLINGLCRANMAHVLMLIEEKIVDPKAGLLILTALSDSLQKNCDDIEVNAMHGDVYNSMDMYLNAKIGDASGAMHAGRARREAVNIGFTLEFRKRYLSLSHSYMRLSKTLLFMCEKHKDTITTDYTYLHHAQPTALGHYLGTFLEPMLRDFDRFASFYHRLNSSVAGSASVNGSSLPINRSRMSELLGFEYVSNHARDSMWQPDIPMEGAFLITSAMTNISRLCEELIIWNTEEFSLVELPDQFCRASVIMPQKKNPYPLAYIRGLAKHLSGIVAEFSSLSSGVTGFPDTRTFVYDKILHSLESVNGAFKLLEGILKKIEFNEDLMDARVNQSYGFSTDLADYLILNSEVKYQTAHKIVGKFVKTLIEEGRQIEEGDAKTLNILVLEHDRNFLEINDQTLISITSAKNIIKSRLTEGSASSEHLNAYFVKARKQIDVFKGLMESNLADVQNSEIYLEREVADLQNFYREKK